MTTYTLRSEELQKHFVAIWPEFLEELNRSCTLFRNSDCDCVHVDVRNAGLLFPWDEIKASAPYDPNGWNVYPDVTPPERQAMIIESQNTKTGLTMIYSAYFKDDSWFISSVELRGDVCPVSPANRVIRFRPLFP